MSDKENEPMMERMMEKLLADMSKEDKQKMMDKCFAVSFARADSL